MLSRQLNLPKRSNDMFAPTRHNHVLDITSLGLNRFAVVNRGNLRVPYM